VPLYAYEFTYKKAPWYFPGLHFDHGAAHTIDIQFLFPDWHGGPLGIQHTLNAQEHALSRELVAAWTNFMYTGNPNLKGERPWPRKARRSICRRTSRASRQSLPRSSQQSTNARSGMGF
jgi:para-nitrobenzyl esterase